MAEEQLSKWKGKESIESASITAEQVWACLEDFCNAHKWLPNLDTCYLVEGVPGQPGLVRYCASSKSDGHEVTIRWVKEKLILMDPIQRWLSYEVTDNNVGIKSYVATIKVFPINFDNGMKGCRIEWSYVADPFEGWKFEDFASHIDYSLKFMTKKMEHASLLMGQNLSTSAT
ncbi:hypothetical protein CICLE_v10009701mg [Citrus x clementina]|uniref:Polyketide cyclase/dehydrase and lipid transporter n=2 Tax=Citrus TaxID=2706 RepID=A0ACB8NNB2_CITSI|nr:lachrymatory-factor synthase [Citrus x clementina]ESR63951.1 hypothetical protein CICLE_v10009701mg [Citrus x clementina]KAH9799682.1 polyketide cyclase/dehydrase and lipid transporter [Citrus sinensis]